MLTGEKTSISFATQAGFSARGSLFFDDVRVPASHLLGGRALLGILCLQTLWLKDQDLPHGHGAYSADLPFEQRLRDLLGLQIGDGTAQIMKLVIARQKAGRPAAPRPADGGSA